MSRASNWKAELAAILQRNNGQHAHGHKVVSERTRAARACGLFLCFQRLRQLGYEIAPARLGNRHVQALVRYWLADPADAPQLHTRGLWRGQPYSAAYIQLQLSFLRVFCGWIGKPGMIGPTRQYITDPALGTRRLAATRERAWDAHGVDVDAVLARVATRNPYVGIQLALVMAFGMRRKEAVMFCPAAAEVPAANLFAEHQNERYLMFVRVKRGTKGGRLRFTAVRNAVQQQVLERARALAGPAGHVGTPGLSLKQSLALFSNTMRAVGVTRAQLGVTLHGLRHQFACDLYVELTGYAPPLRAAERPDPALLALAYRDIARQLGHNRSAVSAAYLGSPRAGQVPASTALLDGEYCGAAAPQAPSGKPPR